MARPQKLNAEWYTHNGNLRNDRRVKAIRTATGPAGYGILHMLLETLTDADYTTLSMDEFEVELLAGDFGTTADEINAVLNVAKKVGYFQVDAENMLTCAELNKWLELHFSKRNRSRNTADSASDGISVTETPVTVTEIPHNTIQDNTEHNNKPSSLRSEGAPAGAASEPPKKTAAEPPAEKPDASASHARGAADVGTSITARPHAYDPANISTALVLPFDTDTFRALWVGYRQYREEQKFRRFNGGMMEQEALRTLSNLANGNEETAHQLIAQAIRKGWQDIYKLDEPRPSNPQQHAVVPARGQKPTVDSTVLAGSLAERRWDQRHGGTGDSGQAAGPYPGSGSAEPAGVRVIGRAPSRP